MNYCLLCGHKRDNESELPFTNPSWPDSVLRLMGVLSADEAKAFADGLLNTAVLVDHEFQRRFPAEHKAWCSKYE